LKIESVPIEKLTFDPANARKHSDANLAAIAGSLKEFGQRKPIVITFDNVIVAGNGTVEAAKFLGLTDVDVVRVPKDWGADQVKAFALADNRSAELAEWNPEVLSAQLLELEQAGFDIEALGFDVKQEEPIKEVDNDDAPAVPDEAVTKLGDVWKLGNHTVMCGDATDIDLVESLVSGANIEMVFTDPPYGISHSGKGISGSAKANDFGEILGDGDTGVAIDAFNLCTVLYPDACLIFWGANYYASALPNGFGWIVWDKEREGDTFSGAELAFVNGGVRVDVFRHQWHGMIKASERGTGRLHPTQKPIALVDWCFSKYGKPSTVLDLFGGSGSTLIACEAAKSVCYMMELDPKYCDVIIERWEKMTGEKAVLDESSR
jgi:16S rRNA G966 N2-methylase RsmD